MSECESSKAVNMSDASGGGPFSDTDGPNQAWKNALSTGEGRNNSQTGQRRGQNTSLLVLASLRYVTCALCVLSGDLASSREK